MNNNRMKMFKNLALLTQLGLSLIAPLLVCMFVCWWIIGKTGAGSWVYIIGTVLGLGASFMTAYNFYKSINRKHEKENEGKKTPVSFNDHI